MTRLQLAPSILTADFGHLADEVRSVEGYVDWFHLDVMDGHYVDNLTFGPSTVEAIAAVTGRPLHVHLMISDPVKYAPVFAAAGAHRISFHPEVVDDVGAAIAAISAEGVGVGLAIHPDVGIEVARPHLGELAVLLMMTVRPGFGGQKFLAEVLPKISDAAAMLKASERSGDIAIEVDGGINLETLEGAVSAGGQILVAGSAIFDGRDAPAAARRLRHRLDELTGRSG
jgi:ribulose-phosphate 3-epimerase